MQQTFFMAIWGIYCKIPASEHLTSFQTATVLQKAQLREAFAFFHVLQICPLLNKVQETRFSR